MGDARMVRAQADGHGERPAQMQLSLFPDGAEVQAAAVAALRDLDVRGARRLFERARRQNPRLVNLRVIDEALRLLEAFLKERPPDSGCLAEIVLEAGNRHLAGQLAKGAVEFADDTIARYWKRHGRAGPFLDEQARVHRGVLDLVLGDAVAARRELEATLEGGCRHRADLWGYLGDACLALERSDEANACYVRALLLSAAGVDLTRIRLRPLARLHGELRRVHPADHARELLPVHAWLEGFLDIPPDNDWLAGHVAQLRARARADAGSPPPQRLRRFALLLYLDRSTPPDRVDLEQRREMSSLDKDLFERFMRACRDRDRG